MLHRRTLPALHEIVVALSAIAVVGCAPALGDARAPSGGHDLAAGDGAGAIEITEPDATVAASLAPLVLSAGPSNLFVTRSSARCSAEMALVGDHVCVDRWEASVVRVAPASASGGQQLVPWSPYDKLDDLGDRYRAVSRPGVVPQGYISGHQAENACRASGKRLCTASEWEVGCRGPGQSQFPYGNERRASVCNDDVRAKHPVVEAAAMQGVFGDRVWLDGMNLAIINQLPDTLAKTGERAECVSEEGVFDMVGNLHEWVADADGTFRGGYYMDTTQNGDGCSYRTSAHDFEYHDYSTGFRCCADPEPIE